MSALVYSLQYVKIASDEVKIVPATKRLDERILLAPKGISLQDLLNSTHLHTEKKVSCHMFIIIII